ncbi:M20/M25/M40 family metallo-hydrolase [Zooshikella harenae]|uniref:M20/M25/M40 family metallo-hydrolase n=1 Tax=Zooshikella harenae TaxID=2827238 RepID=A0ABS5Z734_9GAMM|nr:M20/M25/M40 family metallo-hydrolase [Zooshikella harenae]MBU2709868.1 M20/M25/M40 family metallo-hydrolase [Zooshikella harenae]
MLNKRQLKVTFLATTLAAMAGCSQNPTHQQILPETIKKNPLAEAIIKDTNALVAIPSYRSEGRSSHEVQQSFSKIKSVLDQRIEGFNQQQQHLKIQGFEWQKSRADQPGDPYRLFGYRLGNGPEKLSFITHLDTVAPGGMDWQPFQPRIEQRELHQTSQPFLVGRGAVDNKGPAMATLNILQQLAKDYDATPATLNNMTLEVWFDTSEETDMATPKFLAENPQALPDLGIVFDASWCIRAEKGIERPQFFTTLGTTPKQGIWIHSINTPRDSPTNQIPSETVTILQSNAPKALDDLANQIQSDYQHYAFDDPEYHRAPMTVTRISSTQLKLTTSVIGAQHGSVPYANRKKGANPLVSITNFLAHLADNGTLQKNGLSQLSQFVAWTWGTKVFGEHHPTLLQKQDKIFTTGTTYAITRLQTEPTNNKATLAVDIRYAVGHQDKPWDGKTFGLLPGKSQFQTVFTQLTQAFNKQHLGSKISFNTSTRVTPDIRDTESPNFQLVNNAYRKVMGEDCPAHAIGGGTDAKGFLPLIAAGPMLGGIAGPPVNYHGINEAVPLEMLLQSTTILYELAKEKILNSQSQENPTQLTKKNAATKM